MAVFEVQAPDGSIYHVEADDEDTAKSGLKQDLEGSAPAKPSSFAQSMLDALQRVSISPAGPPAIPSLMEMGKGVPIAGRFMPQTDAMTKLEQEQPTKAGFQRLGGAAISTIAPAAAVTRLTGPNLLPNIAGQSTLGAGLNTGDVIAEKGSDVSNDDILHALEFGAASGTVGPVFGKLITPASKAEHAAFQAQQAAFRRAREGLAGDIRTGMGGAAAQARNLRAEIRAANAAGDSARASRAQAELDSLTARFNAAHDASTATDAAISAAEEAAPKAPLPSWAGKVLDWGLGGISGHQLTGGSYLGAGLGALLARQIGFPSGSEVVRRVADTRIGQRYFRNQIMHNPDNAAILNALAQGTAGVNRTDVLPQDSD